MYAKVVVDKQGKVISAAYRPPETPPGQPEPNLGPVVEDGHELVEISEFPDVKYFSAAGVADRLRREVEAIRKPKK